MRPFVLQNLKATPDDKGDYQVRLKAERKFIKELNELLQEQQAAILPTRRKPADIEKLDGSNSKFKNVLFYGLVGAALLGWHRSEAQVEAIGLSVDPLTADDAIKDWVMLHSLSLVNDINNNTRRAVQKKLAAWAESGAPLDTLVKDLEPVFGPKRAELIASTEITNAYAKGNIEAWKAGKMADKAPEQSPALHPRCRCWLTLDKRGEIWYYIWQTANDERVCPQCGPLHNKTVGEARSLL